MPSQLSWAKLTAKGDSPGMGSAPVGLYLFMNYGTRELNALASVLRRSQSRTAAHLVVQFGCPLVIPVGQNNREFIVVRVSLLLGVDDQGCSHAILIIDAGVRVVPASSRASGRSCPIMSCAPMWLEQQKRTNTCRVGGRPGPRKSGIHLQSRS